MTIDVVLRDQNNFKTVFECSVVNDLSISTIFLNFSTSVRLYIIVFICGHQLPHDNKCSYVYHHGYLFKIKWYWYCCSYFINLYSFIKENMFRLYVGLSRCYVYCPSSAHLPPMFLFCFACVVQYACSVLRHIFFRTFFCSCLLFRLWSVTLFYVWADDCCFLFLFFTIVLPDPILIYKLFSTAFRCLASKRLPFFVVLAFVSGLQPKTTFCVCLW